MEIRDHGNNVAGATTGGGNNGEDEDDDRASSAFDPDANKYRRKRDASGDKFSTWWSLFILGYCLSIFFLVVYMDQRLPTPLRAADADSAAVPPGSFVEERARAHLKKITSVGPRPAGERDSVDFSRTRSWQLPTESIRRAYILQEQSSFSTVVSTHNDTAGFVVQQSPSIDV